jgi:hypothetical protein
MNPQPTFGNWGDEMRVLVLADGLTSLPSDLDVGSSVAVARWVGPRLAAILKVERASTFSIGLVAETFERVDGHWKLGTWGGGEKWFEPPLQRPTSIGDRDMRVLGMWGSTLCRLPYDSDAWLRCIYGIAGSAARSLEVTDRHGTTTAEFESPIGAFVVVADLIGEDTEPGMRILDDHGAALTFSGFGPIP